MGIQNVLVGHAEEEIDDAACAALRRGQNFSRPTDLEVEAAEALIALFPGMDMVKFAKNGSDANTAALRLARAVTGRDVVAYDESAPFLSIHDWFIGGTAMNAGVPKPVNRTIVSFRYNDVETVEALFDAYPHQLAAVILEPCRDIRPDPGFFERLRALCDTHGTLLIFDEVVTGFRYSLHGAYSLLGVRPDLMAVGKGMANGYALSALVGKRDIMERGGLRHSEARCFLMSTTNGAERSALAAGLATIRFYLDNDVIGRLYQVGRAVMQGINDSARKHGIAHYVRARSDFDCRPMLDTFDDEGRPSLTYRTLLLQELAKNGLLLSWICPSFRHGEAEISRTLRAFDAACGVYAQAIHDKSVARYLEGPPIQPVFRSFNNCLQSRCGRLYPDAEKLECCGG
jgi:glutamate-1-semialdehyde 2,1-aminomutase